MKMDNSPSRQGQLPHGLSAVEALFVALEDRQTASFLTTYFSSPEQRPDVFSLRWVIRTTSGWLWQVAIIEKSPFLRKPTSFLNVAHLIIDAANGKIRERWFLGNILFEEYREFLRSLYARREDCRARKR